MLVSEKTRLKDFTALDISQAYLKKVADAVGCRCIHGSMLDEAVVASLEGGFDYCLAVSLLHHIIGDTRRHSRELALRCLKNCFRLLKPGGHLIVFEPAYDPEFMMDIVFAVKKFFSCFSDGRMEIFREWFNIGNPVVSYYTPEMLSGMAVGLGGEVLLFSRLGRGRIGYILERTQVGFIVRKPA